MNESLDKHEKVLARIYGPEGIPVFWKIARKHAELKPQERLPEDVFRTILHAGLLRAHSRGYRKDEAAAIWRDYIHRRDGISRRTVREEVLTADGVRMADRVIERLADDGWHIDPDTREIVERLVAAEARDGLSAHSFQLCVVEALVRLDTAQGIIPTWIIHPRNREEG